MQSSEQALFERRENILLSGRERPEGFHSSLSHQYRLRPLQMISMHAHRAIRSEYDELAIHRIGRTPAVLPSDGRQTPAKS